MGALVGLAFSLGCYLVWATLSSPRLRRASSGPGLSDRLAELIARAGLEAVTPARLVASSAGLAVVAFLLVVAISCGRRSRSPSV